MGNNYGYWSWNRKNGLEGSPSIRIENADGEAYWVKDPTFPAVLSDDFILFALQNSAIARTQFNTLYPSLDPRSQARLQELLAEYPRVRQSLANPFFSLSPQGENDEIQKRDVTSGIHLEYPERKTP